MIAEDNTNIKTRKNYIPIIKCEFVFQTNKKKFFVLRKGTDAIPAQLEYYDSEKKYKAGGPPKRRIVLKSCFNINKKTDCKQKFVIAIYTKEDCFCVQCKSEEEREEWLASVQELQAENESEEEPRPFFGELIWCRFMGKVKCSV